MGISAMEKETKEVTWGEGEQERLNSDGNILFLSSGLQNDALPKGNLGWVLIREERRGP